MRSRAVVGAIAVAVVGAVAVPATAVVRDRHAVTPAPARLASSLAARLADAAPEDRMLLFVHGRDAGAAAAAVERSGLEVVDRWEQIGVVVTPATAADVDALRRRDGVTYLEADRPMVFHLDTSQNATRAGEAARMTFAGPGGKAVGPFDGSGISVAVVDSGIDGTHPMFRRGNGSKVVRNLKFSCGVAYACDDTSGTSGSTGTRDELWIDTTAVRNDTDTGSASGHGTHVAGIAAGVPVEVEDGQQLRGAAPGATLIGLSVGQGVSVYAGFAGLNWVLEHHAAPCGKPSAICPPIRVVNNSWGPVGGGEHDPESIEAKLTRKLVAKGVTVVWAAGNDGGDGTATTTHPEGTDPTPGVISVANYDDLDKGTRDNTLADTSSRGDNGDRSTYPDLSAPGSRILSACRPWLAVCTEGPGDYANLSGTSMAAPHVAGYVAVLQQAARALHGRYLTPGEIENVLEDTAHQFRAGGEYVRDPTNPDHSTSFDKGHGLVDIAAALKAVAGQPLSRPAAQAVCGAGRPLTTDPTDDLNAAPAPGDRSLDITELWGAWDATAQRLVLTVKVADLGAANPVHVFRSAWMTEFVYGKTVYWVRAARTSLGEEYTFGYRDSVGRLRIAETSGKLDASANVIRVVLPNSVLRATGIQPFRSGTALGPFTVTAVADNDAGSRSLGLVADEAAGRCGYRIGSGAGGVGEPNTPIPDGVAAPGEPYAWSGGPMTASPPEPTGVLLVRTCASPGRGCDNRYVDVRVPEAGGKMVVDLGGFGDNDLDLFVYGPDGREVGSSAAGGAEAEKVVVPLSAGGLYRVAVAAFDANKAKYTARVTVLAEPLPKDAYDGVLRTGTRHAWDGQPQPVVMPVAEAGGCTSPSAPYCDHERLWVQHSGRTLSISVAFGGGDDFDVYLFGPDGELVDDAATSDNPERITVPDAAAGVYTVSVLSFFSTGGGYRALAALT